MSYLKRDTGLASSQTLPKQSSSGDTLANVISTLEVLQVASNAAVNVPFLAAIFGTVLSLVKTVEVCVLVICM